VQTIALTWHQYGQAKSQYQCPRDVSVTTFNNMPFADPFAPPLTTVHIPHDDLGLQASLLKNIETIWRSPASKPM
jgi:DNA-binding LacI/PurR family transcriptional regulator